MLQPLTLEARERARRLFLEEGFARVGFTRADPVPDLVSGWVREGRHASMGWMATDPARRADPRHLLPGARSVICVAAAYPATDAKGAIAGYARGEDYHRTMKEALRRAVGRLEERMEGLQTRVCVDTAPLLERALAARAGLGWIGRNTMLLDTLHGPWMLLGEVITDADFPPDGPVPDRCGTCTACVDACPTDALDTRRNLDARRCLSYWTIEHRGEVPPPWAEEVGHRVFGCDDCLTACPFPAHAPPALRRASPLEPRADLVRPSLDDLEQRAAESFRRHFASTPIERARKEGLLRNLRQCRRAAATAKMPPALSEESAP